MQKLLNAYAEKSTFKNALAISVYIRKHPMAACLLDIADSYLLKIALKHANKAD